MTFMQAFRKFIRYYRPYRGLFYFDMICALAVCAIDLAFPQILNLLTKNLFLQPAETILSALWYIGAGLLAMYIVRYGCQYFITSWGHIMGARMESDMRQDLFDHFQRLSFSYYDRNNTGEMMSKLVSDLFDISELAHHGPENIVISTLKIIGAFTILMFMNVPMTLLLLAVTLIMVVFSLGKNRRMHRIFMDNRRKIAAVNARVQDSLSGIRVVKSFANEEVECEKFDDCNRSFLDSKTDSYKIMGSFHAGNSFFQGLLYTLVLVSGGYFIAVGRLEPMALAIYALYIGIFLNPIEVLINFTEQFQRGYSGFKRFMEVIQTRPEITDSPDAKPLAHVEGHIVYDHVSFRYGNEAEVLSDINIDITPGKTVALVGPSGGGKTTLCQLLPRFYDVTSGSVCIDGIDVRTVTQASLRRCVGVLQQEVFLFADTIRENIRYGRPDATDAEIEQAARYAEIDREIRAMPDGYDTYVGERGVMLSGGQKQRLSIARLFLKNPQILILDEATSALDSVTEQRIQNALDTLARGRTCIIIAHRLSTVQGADRVAVIDGAHVCEQGTPAELIARDGKYAALCRAQHLI